MRLKFGPPFVQLVLWERELRANGNGSKETQFIRWSSIDLKIDFDVSKLLLADDQHLKPKQKSKKFTKIAGDYGKKALESCKFEQKKFV